MEDVRKLIPRTPPEGLKEWADRNFPRPHGGLVYEAVWVDNLGLERYLDEYADVKRIKEVEVRCSICGERTLLSWAKTQKNQGGFGFMNPEEDWIPVGSGDDTVCPYCGASVRVKKASEIRESGWVIGERFAVSASVVGDRRYLALTEWVLQDRVHKSGYCQTNIIPAESYVFSPGDCYKLVGWRNSYSGKSGYFISYQREWRQPKKWTESLGQVRGIYGLTPELIAKSCLPNCKLDVYMSSFADEANKFPVPYLRLFQVSPNTENILLNGLPLVLDGLLDQEVTSPAWDGNIRGFPAITEIDWRENRPAQMLGLSKEELRMARSQGWGVYLWRVFLTAKDFGERLSKTDMINVFLLCDKNLLNVAGRAPIGKTVRYLLRQIELAGLNSGEYDENGNPLMEDVIDVTMLIDYWYACGGLGRNLNNSQVRWPRDLIGAHEAATFAWSERRDAFKERAINEKFRIRRRQLAKYIFEADGLIILPAYSQADMKREGEELNHCVGTYARKHADGDTAIFFIRRKLEPQKSYYTLEFDEKALAVRQNRGNHNCARTPKVEAFENLWLSWVRAGAKRDKNGRPVLPERDREVGSA